MRVFSVLALAFCKLFALAGSTGGTCVAADSQMERILELSSSKRSSAIADQLLENAQPLANKTLSFKITATGIHGDRDEQGYVLSVSRRSALTFVTSLNAGFASYNFGPNNPFKSSVVTFGGVNSSLYDYGANGEIVQVIYSCEQPKIPFVLSPFGHFTLASGWYENSHAKASLLRIIDEIREAEWNEVRDVAGVGKVIVLQKLDKPRPDRKFSERRQEFFFAERQGMLLWVGQELSRRSEGKHEVHGDCISVDRKVLQLEYDFKKDHPLLSQVRDILTLEVLDLDLMPLQPPLVERNLTLKVLRCDVLDSFPTELTKITVPTSAKVVDDCSRQAERARAE